MNTETMAVGVVMQAISCTGRLVPFFTTNDKEPVWDGHVGVYGSTKKPHSKNDLLLRVPVQIKGQEGRTDEEEIRYPVKLSDLRQYRKENPTMFFVVRVGELEKVTIYYHLFTKGHAENIIREKGEQDKALLPFWRFPTALEEREKLFLDLVEGRATTYPVESSPTSLSDTDIFLYTAGIVGFYGREREMAQLDEFLHSPGTFRWWGVIGPGGAGKSRLGYEWGKQIREQGWTVLFLKMGDYKKLDALTEEHPEPLLLIADYVQRHTAALGAWAEKFRYAGRESPLRLLLLERDEGVNEVGESKWEQELYNEGDEGYLRDTRYERLLQLPALEDTPLKELIAAFAAALRGRNPKLPILTEKDADMLLTKLGEIDETLRRPLYAMVLTDAFLRDPVAAHWTQEKLLSRLVLREREQIKKAVRTLQIPGARLDEVLVQAALRLRCLATALGTSGDRELEGLLALDVDLDKIFEKKADHYNFSLTEDLLLYLGLLRYADEKPLVPAIRPDLMGEYALLHWLTEAETRPREKTTFYTAALQDWELRTFFQRLYADFAPLLNAKPERWKKLLPKMEGLDDDGASLYTHLLNDGFDRCMDRVLRGHLLDETARLADRVEADTPAAANIFNNLGLLYNVMGDYPQAIVYLKRNLAISENEYGTEHPETATDYNNLGTAYFAQGDYTHAQEYFRKAMAIWKKVLGEMHPETAKSYTNLGELFRATGNYPLAQEYCQRAMAIWEKVYGEEHPDTATSYNSLGGVYDAVGDYPRALEYHQKALAIYTKVYGEEHPETAKSYNNLGLVYYAQGDYPRALEYHQKALAIWKKVHGEEHPETAKSYNNLGEVYCAQGDYPCALEYHQKALAIYTKVYGEEHPNTAKSYNNLGEVYYAMGDYPRALEHYQKALAIYTKVLGEESPDTATSYNNLGELFRTTGNYPLAQEYHQKALAIYTKVLSEEHPDTAASYNNLGELFQTTGNYPLAQEYHQKALTIYIKVYGEEHPNTAKSYNNLGAVYHAMGDYPHALEHYQKALAIYTKVLGEESPDTATSYNNLGEVYRATGEYPLALQYYEKALAIYAKIYSEEHPNAAMIYNNMGLLYDESGNYPLALKYYEKTLAIDEKIYGKKHPNTANDYNNMGEAYRAMREYTRALKYHRKALAIREKVYGEENLDTAASYNNLGGFFYEIGKYQQARKYMQKAVTAFESILDPENPNTENSRMWLEKIDEKLGQKPKKNVIRSVTDLFRSE